MKYIIMPMLLGSMFALSSCREESIFGEEGNILTITLEMPGEQKKDAPRRVGLNPIENTKDFYATWSPNDKVQVILCGNNEIYDLGRAQVTNLSDDKRTATVNIDMRNTPNVLLPYTLFLFAGNDNPASADRIGGGNFAAYCTYELQREVGGYFHAPLYCRLQVRSEGEIPTAQFQHFGTYEVLHVNNATDRPITFSHQGFETDRPWYQASTTIWFYDGYDTSPHGEWDGDSESQTMTIMPHSENVVYSWYIPSGFSVSDARLVACINGEYNIQSTNTFSSTVIPQTGHAYHMYATWDGKELKFDKGGDSPQDYPVADIIDLGLPSGTRWASFDMGATKSGEFGSEYAWGETEVKEKYTEENYLYSGKNLGSCISGTEYDVAHVNWGDNWQMPTKAQFEELINKCSIETVEEYGIKGMKFTGPNGSSIFFPFEEGRLGSYSTYWSGTADEGSAYILFVDDDGTASLLGGSSRYFGRFVRPVEISKMVPPVLTITPEDGKINFGVVMQDTEKTETLSVKNTSTNVVTIYLDADKGFENTIEVSDNMEEITLSPGASKDYSITAHGLPAGYSASTNVFVRMVGSDEVTKVNLTFIGNDYSPLVSETTMTLAVGEKGSVRVKPSNVKIELDVDGIVDGIGGGPGEGIHLDEEHESVIYSQSFGLTFTALKAGVVHVTFSDSYTEQIEVLTITVTDGPSYPVAEAIDLGLPSGTKWASWNVGATKPEEYGGYYAWGETEEKDYYDWSTYKYCDGTKETCHHIGDDIAGTEYDVAHVKWGGSWRMPTTAQQDELRENCTREWTQQNGVNGIRVTGPNGNSIFLPAAGYRWYDYLGSEGEYGYYWSSSFYPDDEGNAGDLGFGSDNWSWDGSLRYDGQSVRAVCP